MNKNHEVYYIITYWDPNSPTDKWKAKFRNEDNLYEFVFEIICDFDFQIEEVYN